MIQLLIEKLRKHYKDGLITVTVDFYNFTSSGTDVEWRLSIAGEISQTFPTWPALLEYANGLMTTAGDNVVRSEIVVMGSMDNIVDKTKR